MKWKKAVSSTGCGERVNWLYCNHEGHDDHEVYNLTDNSSSFVTFELFMVNKTPVFTGNETELQQFSIIW
jgi:hypothetical protein